MSPHSFWLQKLKLVLSFPQPSLKNSNTSFW